MHVYHRTNSIKNVQAIREGGFRPSLVGLYGPGVYCTQDLATQLTPYMSQYGDYIVKSSLDITNFLNYDSPDWAEKLSNTIHQTVAKYPNLAPLGRSDLSRIQALVSSPPYYSSDIALEMYEQLIASYFDYFDGVMFTGRKDGRTVLVFKQSVTKLKPQAFIRSPAKFKYRRLLELLERHGAHIVLREDDYIKLEFGPPTPIEVRLSMEGSPYTSLHFRDYPIMIKSNKLLMEKINQLLQDIRALGYTQASFTDNYIWLGHEPREENHFAVGNEKTLADAVASQGYRRKRLIGSFLELETVSTEPKEVSDPGDLIPTAASGKLLDESPN